MVKLKLLVTEARDRTAVATLTAVGHLAASGYAVATASKEIAAANSNPQCDPMRPWGHPPTGKYWLVQRERLKYSHSGEYGWHALLFEAEAGDALAAQATGREGLLVYGGPDGEDHLMRRTQGGVRIDNKMMELLTGRFSSEYYTVLEIELLRKPAWWQFWKRMPETPALSTSPVKDCPAPLDEAGIMAGMLKDLKIKRSHTGSGTYQLSEPQHEPGQSRASESPRPYEQDQSSWQSNSISDTYQGGGGDSGGGGAGGSWDSGSSSDSGSTSSRTSD